MEYEKINLDERIFRFIYISAMRDAINQQAYKASEKIWLSDDEAFNSLKSEIRPFIDNVLNNEYSYQGKYDEDFLDITISVCKYVNCKAQNNNFTFGNAQKLINMMLKYFYITGYESDKQKECFRFCHCPMDGKLLKNVWNKCKKSDNYRISETYDWFTKSWGNEDFEVDENGKMKYPKRYLVFQQAVHFLLWH